MNRKLIDIFPPNRPRTPDAPPEAPESETRTVLPTRRLKTSYKILAAVLVLLIIPLALVHAFFSRATITIWPQMSRLHIEETISAHIGAAQMDSETKTVRARQYEENHEMIRVFPSSGSAAKQEKARGIIRVFNENSASSQTLVGNTRFISEGGKLFRSEERVVIPAAGSLDIEVSAAEVGESYNIEPSNFSLPGLAGSALYTKVYGKSTAKMAGGAERKVAVVTERDIRDAKEKLFTDLKAKAERSLLTSIPEDFTLIDDSFMVTVLEDSSLAKEGAELDEFSYMGKVQVKAVGFAKDDIKVLARDIVRDYLNQTSDMNEASLQVAVETAEFTQGKAALPLKLSIMVDQYEKVNTRDLKSRFSGVQEADFQDTLESFPYLARAQISLWPFWTHTLPESSEKVEVELLLDQR
jgi:hypothetical protein